MAYIGEAQFRSFVTYLFNQCGEPHKIAPNLLIYKYFTRKSLFLKDLEDDRC